MIDRSNEQATRAHVAEGAAVALLAFAEGLAVLAERPGEEGLSEARAHFERGRALASAIDARPVAPAAGRAEVVINFNGGCICGGPRALGEALSRALKAGGAPVDRGTLG